jgi:cell division transport system ATP-binding protein
LKRSQIPHLRRSMGVVFQDFRLLQDKTVYENVAFAMDVVEAPSKDIRRQVPMMLGMVGLSKKSKQYPHQLSGGEQQRVSIARAMVNSPSILVADEPTGNLDPEMSVEIMKLFSEINQRGTTILMATHDLHIVDKMKKRVVEINEGNIIRDEKRGGYFSENQNR